MPGLLPYRHRPSTLTVTDAKKVCYSGMTKIQAYLHGFGDTARAVQPLLRAIYSYGRSAPAACDI